MKTISLTIWIAIAGSVWAAGADASVRRPARERMDSAWSLSFAETGRDGASEVYAKNFSRRPDPGPVDWGAVKELVAFCRDHKAGLMIRTGGGAWGYSFLGPVYGVTYQVDDEASTNEFWRGSDTGDAAVLPGDALDFLRSLPDPGSIKFRVTDSFGRDHEGAFRLRGVAAARRLIAAACPQRE